MMRFAILCLLIPFPVIAQTSKPKDLSPPGYKRDNLRGFILFISNESIENDKKSKLERSPLEAIERELIQVEKVVPAEKLKALKNVPIWVEWDETLAMSNGRGGQALAVFYGGHQQDLLSEAKREVKTNSITLLKLRSLTNAHQPKNGVSHSIILHEMAHAYHHFVLGKGNPYLAAAYKQAMERKLYDPTLYAATNESEYFAELTCAYLERLDYYPRNRADLKKHDVKGFELMEMAWGKIDAKRETLSKGPSLPSADGGGKYNLNIQRENLVVKQARIGELPDMKQFQDKPLLLFYWNPGNEKQLVLLSRMNALLEEMADHGFNLISVTNASDPTDTIRDAVNRRGFKLPVVSDLSFGSKSESFSLPHAILYDASGKCIFRGEPHDAEIFVRLEMAKQILAKANKSEWNKTVQPLVDLLESGSALSVVYTKAGTFPELSGQAKADYTLLTDLLSVEAKKGVAEWEGMIKEEPAKAFLHLEALGLRYKGLPIARTATALANKLRGNPKVIVELRARALLDPIKKIDTDLATKKYSFDPTNPEFQLQNSQTLDQLRKAIEKVQKAYPNTQAASDAAKYGTRWLVGVRSSQ